MPDMCDEQCTDVTGFSYVPTSFESPESSVSCQRIGIQSGFNLEPLGIGHGADNLYGDAAGSSGDWPLTHTMTLMMNESEMTATEECKDTFSVAPNLLNDSSSQQDCTCISCLEIGIHWTSRRALLLIGGLKCRFPGCLTILNV